MTTKNKPKRSANFFISDVFDVVDYAEHMAEKFENPDEFKRQVALKLTTETPKPMKCELCSATVSPDDYQAHMEAHHPNPNHTP